MSKELAELDRAVALAEGWAAKVCEVRGGFACYAGVNRYQPTRDGAEAMRLLERHKMDLTWRKLPDGEEQWQTYAGDDGCGGPAAFGSGPSPAIAICRAVVALSAPEGRDKEPPRAEADGLQQGSDKK